MSRHYRRRWGWPWTVMWRRSLASVALPLLIATGAVLLLAHPQEWAASWNGLAARTAYLTIVTGPLATALACWEAGHERRSGARGMLASTPRARWHREVIRFSVVASAVGATHLAIFAVGAAFVAPVATYTGGRWWAMVILSLFGMITCCGIGWLAGGLIDSRLTAPILAITCYIGIGSGLYFSAGWVQLLPTGRYLEGTRLTAGPIAGTLVFYALVTAALLIAGTAHRWWLAAVPAIAAILTAVPLSSGGQHSWLEVDAGAQELACTDDRRVCVWQTHAGLLDAVAEEARPLLERITAESGPQYRLVEPAMDLDTDHPVTAPVGSDVIPINVNLRSALSGRDLNYPGVVTDAVRSAAFPTCPEPDDGMITKAVAVADLIAASGSSLADGHSPRGQTRGRTDSPHIIEGTAQGRQEWLSNWIQAARSCDREAMDELWRGVM